MYGAKLVLPGRRADSEWLHHLIVDEGVSIAAAVPTIWLGILEHCRETEQGLGRLRRIFSGGTAPPAAMIEAYLRDYGVRISHGWGMTETTHGGDRGRCTGFARGSARASSQLRAEMVASGRDCVCAGIATRPDGKVAEGRSPASGRPWGHCTSSFVIDSDLCRVSSHSRVVDFMFFAGVRHRMNDGSRRTDTPSRISARERSSRRAQPDSCLKVRGADWWDKRFPGGMDNSQAFGARSNASGQAFELPWPAKGSGSPLVLRRGDHGGGTSARFSAGECREDVEGHRAEWKLRFARSALNPYSVALDVLPASSVLKFFL